MSGFHDSFGNTTLQYISLALPMYNHCEDLDCHSRTLEQSYTSSRRHSDLKVIIPPIPGPCLNLVRIGDAKRRHGQIGRASAICSKCDIDMVPRAIVKRTELGGGLRRCTTEGHRGRALIRVQSHVVIVVLESKRDIVRVVSAEAINNLREIVACVDLWRPARLQKIAAWMSRRDDGSIDLLLL